MRSPRLTLESFEERSLPSAYVPRPDFTRPAHEAREVADHGLRMVTTPVFAVWTGNLVAPDGSVFRVRIVFETNMFVRFDSGAKSDGGQSDRGGQTASGSGSDGVGDDFRSGGETRGIAQGHSTPAQQPAAATPAAVVPPPDSGAAAAPVEVGTTGSSAASGVPAAVVSAGVPVVAQMFSGLTGELTTAGRVFGGDAVDLSAEVPATIPPAAPDADVTPSPAAPADPTAENTFETPVPFLQPIAGVIPVDLITLGATATNFLGRVSDLDVAWPDNMPAFEDYVWTATALLLAGGAVYSATGNRNGRSTRRGTETASALAKWEGKNVGRPY